MADSVRTNPAPPEHDRLFEAEVTDLRLEIMRWGALLPLMALGYVGMFLSYQKPFIIDTDLTRLGPYAAAFGVGLAGMLLYQRRPRLAIWLTVWGGWGVALLFYFSGQDGFSASGIGLAGTLTTLLIGPWWGLAQIGLSAIGLAWFALSNPGAGVWPAHVSAPIVGALMLTLCTQAVSRALFRALRWMHDSHTTSRQQADMLREKSAQLEQALKSLSQTSFALARANEQLELAMQHAEQARQSQQQFAAAVSHELRAPLNLIIGFSDLILNEPQHYQGGPAALPARLLADIRVIHHHAQHLLKLVNDILDLSQMDVNALSVARAPVAIGEVIRSALEDYAYLITQRGLRLRVEIESTLPPVSADETRLRQVLLNLLNNALRFTERGEIAVRAWSVAEGGDRADQPASVVIAVSDTGIGIAPADLGRIFQPFVQIGADRQKIRAGSGLGLTICKRFVEILGGRIWAESAPGEGSTFYVSLPVEENAPPIAPARLAHSFKRREVGALAVVEQYPTLSRLLARQIQGMRVEHAPDLAALASAPSSDGQTGDGKPGAGLPEMIVINESFGPSGDEGLPDALRHVPVLRCYVPAAFMFAPGPVDAPAVLRHRYLAKPVSREQVHAALADLLPASNAADAATRQARVLVVEDEEDASYLLTRLIRLAPPEVWAGKGYAGVTVARARSGEQALEMLSGAVHDSATAIDLVFLDVALGRLSGFDVLSEMERHASLRAIPVCVVTGQVAPGDALVTPYVRLSRQNGLTARELIQAIVSLGRIVLPGVELSAA